MSNPATTFRFDEDIRAELEELKDLLGAPTLQKTVETLIRSHKGNQKHIKDLKNYIGRVETQNALMRERLIVIRSAFKIITDADSYPIEDQVPRHF